MQIAEREYHEIINEYDTLYEATICQERQLPDIKDGMRMIQRRLYWVFLSLARDKRFNLSKSAAIVGDTIKLHNHGDASIYESLVNEVNSPAGLIKGKGNWGCKTSSTPSKPAKMRYTDCSLYEIADIYFRYANFSDMVTSEAGMLEPSYIPVPLPLALIGGFFGIAKIGSSRIPPYKKSDLIKRLNYLLNPIGKEPIIKPWYGNNFEISGDFENLLKTGSGQITIYPIIEIDSKKEVIIIKDFPPTITNLGSILEKISSHPKYSRYIEITDLSSKKNLIVIEYKTKYMKNIDVKFDTVCNFVKKELTSLNTYLILAYRDVNDYPKISIDDWLVTNFKQILKYRKKELDISIKFLEDKLILFNAISLIRPVIQRYLNEYKKFTKEVIEKLKLDSLKILNDPVIVTKVFQLSISKLLESDLDTVDTEIKIKELKKLNNPEEHSKSMLSWINELNTDN